MYPKMQIGRYQKGFCRSEGTKRRRPAGNPLLALTISDEDVTAFSYSSPLTGMKYAYYIQDSTFYADYKVKNRIFLMNFFVSILFNCLILVVLSWINHSTFKKQVLKASKKAGIEIADGKATIR